MVQILIIDFDFIYLVKVLDCCHNLRVYIYT